MGLLKTMKAELEIMRREKIYMEAFLTAAESALEEKRRLLTMYKAMAKLADDFLDVLVEAGCVDNVDESNDQELDDETMKELVEEAIRDFNEALNEAQSRRINPKGGGNGGGYDGGSGDDHNLDGTNTNIGKEAGGSGGGDKGGGGGGHVV
ncbi:keratin, type I cytoskeletal 9-like [Hibiscus syriacus]|uniref:keratin, type I cytoskeletal 9-like n=1 Tax=Hibiscus syriacus TaxID=106335 RepID=UPI00192483A7|nr:keratin, type I cytoskeletal 9-like [Hibiscus syriacus]